MYRQSNGDSTLGWEFTFFMISCLSIPSQCTFSTLFKIHTGFIPLFYFSVHLSLFWLAGTNSRNLLEISKGYSTAANNQGINAVDPIRGSRAISSCSTVFFAPVEQTGEYYDRDHRNCDVDHPWWSHPERQTPLWLFITAIVLQYLQNSFQICKYWLSFKLNTMWCMDQPI